MKRFKYDDDDDDFVCYVLKLLNFRYNKRSSLKIKMYNVILLIIIKKTNKINKRTNCSLSIMLID